MKDGSKGIIIAVVLVLVIGVGAVLAMNGSKTADNTRPMDNMPSNATMTGPMSSSNMASNNVANSEKIEIKGYKFSPETMTVKVGTTVTWTNQDNVRHSVIVDGTDGPKSELLAKGESYSYTFKTAGTFNYFCGPHPYMKASVTVE